MVTKNQTAKAEKNSQTTSLLDQVMEQTRFKPENEDYSIAQRGIAEFISEMLKSDSADAVVNKTLIDEMIVRLDEKISHQVDEILHNDKFQEMESAWRGLKLLIDRTDFRENIKIEVLNVSKEELLDDFEYATDITQSGLYKHVYSANYGQFGGEPVAAIVGNYTFTPSAPDIKLLQYISSVGAMSHAPFISAAGGVLWSR